MTVDDHRETEGSETSALDQVAKKAVIRQLSYGLYAITAAFQGDRGVFTANWLTQVSFEPPLLALSVEHASATLPLIQASGRFAVCPYKEDQRELAGNLGRPRARTGDKFAAYDLRITATASGPPVLLDSLGYVVCDVVNSVPAGDSVLLLGRVIEARVFSEDVPLTMRDARFRHAG